jgi:hypothetical protein
VGTEPCGAIGRKVHTSSSVCSHVKVTLLVNLGWLPSWQGVLVAAGQLYHDAQNSCLCCSWGCNSKSQHTEGLKDNSQSELHYAGRGGVLGVGIIVHITSGVRYKVISPCEEHIL